MFLNAAPQDDTLAQIAAQLRGMGAKFRLGDNKVVDLVLAFVQAIPYDNDRARKILAGAGDPQYPYETLFRQRGVCSDKSLLAAALLRELGYGAALFTYKAEHHMAVAVACPPEYSTYASGYCYAETTTPGHRIGMIPNVDPAEGKAVALAQLAPYDPAAEEEHNLTRLGDVGDPLPIPRPPIHRHHPHQGVPGPACQAHQRPHLPVETTQNGQGLPHRRKSPT